MKRTLLLMMMLLACSLLVFAGCGTGKGFNPNNVTVSIAPGTATVAANGQLPFQATVGGLCSACISTISFWTVTENPSTSDCATLVGISPVGPCPAGVFQLDGANELSVTYIAPSTAGAYHINAEWEDFVNFSGPPAATKTGTAVVTVSP